MKKKLISGLVSLVMLLSLLPVSITTSAADANFRGEGTAESPYLIATAEDLVKLATLTNNANDKTTAAEYAGKVYQLTQDIDMTGVQFTPISWASSMYTAQGAAFTGTLDGNNHVIKNVTFKTISTYGSTYGIIGYLGANGTVKNLGVENMTVPAGTASRFCIGGIAGTLGAGITIENSFVRGMNVTAAPSGTDKTTYVGGIAGRTVGNSGLIKNCYTTSLNFTGVTNQNTTAGILGSSGNTGYKAENCYTTHAKTQGNTSATNSYMGATNCYASSNIASATAENLGDAFKVDFNGKNGGYPLLKWEADANFEGEGTTENPFLINNADDLVKLATLTNNANDKTKATEYASKVYKLTADIDMTGVQFTPISWASSMYTAQGAAFTGILDGNNHVIKNVTFKTISTYGSTYGIIGYLGANGTVKNLGVENMTVPAGTASRFCIGGIAGTLGAGITIENCYVRGMTVTAAPSGSDTTTYVGGVSGRTVGNSGVIKNCYATSLNFTGVTNQNTTAGILGSSGNTGYKAENCYTTHAKTQGNTSASNSYMGTTNCYASGTIADATAETLGDAFKTDTKGNNSGYPLLAWETEKEMFEGEGTAEKPFLIKNASDLTKLAGFTNSKLTAEYYANKYYKLTADIDMTGVQYTPISYATNMSTAQGKAFTGTLDGANHIIKNITFKTVSTYGYTYGLIGYLGANGTVKNLGIENVTVPAGTASRFCIGGIAGSLGAEITIENCYVKGMTVTADPSGTDKTTYVGGIAGRTLGNSGLIKNSYTTNLDFGGVTNVNTTAGILGSSGNTGYKAENCYTLHTKTQGNTSATNSYMGTTNCYTESSIADGKNYLGMAFIADVDSINEGNPVLTWEYEKKNTNEVKKSVQINKIGNGEVNITGFDTVQTVNAYTEQNIAFTLASAEGYILTSVLYNGNALKDNNGKYSFVVENGGELKVVFTEIIDADAEFYVSLSGDDANDGTSVSSAFRTVEAAMNMSKAYKGTKIINFEEGNYTFEEAILLDSDDSNIVLRAYNGAEVSLSGGKKIEKEWFNETSENSNILVADLKANGITEYGRIKSIGYGTYADSTDKNGSPVFAIDGEYMVPARYPNAGYIKTSQIITGADKSSEENLSFKTSDSRVLNWTNEKDAWVFGYFMEDWADANLPITVSADGTIAANGKSSYGAQKGARFYVYNALSELDCEGEYYIDREEGKMYIYKPSNWDGVENMVFSTCDNNIIEIKGAKNVTIEGFTIEDTNTNAIYAENATGLNVKNCNFQNIGRMAMYITGSDNAEIEGNNIKNTGFVGIGYYYAGNRQTLASSNASIKNNIITRTGLQRAASAYAIDVSNTVGVVVSGNDISDLPHGGILYMTCNDTIIEYNKIYDVIKDTSDAGAIYSGRDWTTRGNVIRYNYIHDIVDIKNANNASAVYLDDMHSSTDVYNNVIYKVPQAMLLGGGRNNSFTNNLIIDCNNWIEADQRGTRTNLDYMKHMLSQVQYTSEAWSKYSNLSNILDDEPAKAKYNTIKDNVTYNSSSAKYPDLYNLTYTVGSPKKITDKSFFCSYNDKEFGLSQNAMSIDSGAYNLIKDIPFEKMGFAVSGVFKVENVEISEVGTELVASVKMVNNSEKAVATKLVIAQYNNGKLVKCSSKDILTRANTGVTEESLIDVKDTETTNVKVFLWDENMKPLWK